MNDTRYKIDLANWRHCVVLVSINEVALHRARLLLGWVTVCWPSQLPNH